MLMVPPTISTPPVISIVPSTACFSPPASPAVVFVVSTLHWKFGTARTTTPTASQMAGPITTARPTKQAAQNTTLAIFLRTGICGHPAALPLPGAGGPGGEAEVDRALLPLIATAPGRREGPCRRPAAPAAWRSR